MRDHEVLPAPQQVGELFRRYEGNPILTADDWPYPCNTVFNPAAVRLDTGETLLLVRVEDHRGVSHLTVARSPNGLTDWTIDPEPTLVPDPERWPEETWGIEDPRIVWLEEMGCYAVTYTAFSEEGPAIALALTEDFRTFERRGLLMPPEDKNGVLFPRKIGGYWVLLHRTSSMRRETHPAIWLSRSPDLRHWSGPRVVLRPRPGIWWDHVRIGAGPPPIETPEGWLLIYHGVRTTVAGDIYRVGMALLDLENPARIIRRAPGWILGPRAPYERIGDVPNVVFPCGYVLDGDTLRLYYGAADTCVAVAEARLSELLDWLLNGHYNGQARR